MPLVVSPQTYSWRGDKRLHILLAATIRAGTRGTYCSPKAHTAPGCNVYQAFNVVRDSQCTVNTRVRRLYCRLAPHCKIY